MAATSRILSLEGKVLNLENKADVEPWIRGVDPSTIEEVHLSGNTIGVDASEALANFLQQATSLKIANFADIFTRRLVSEIPLALTALCNALIDKTSLIEINLSDNAFGERSVAPLLPLLTQNRSFQVLKLNNNGLGPAGGTAIANALLESARLSKKEGKPSNLRTLVCGRNRLEDGSAPVWAEAFAAHGTLQEVRMPQNGIRIHGITALAKGLAECKDLQHIDLQDNTFTDSESDAPRAVKAWAEALPSWPRLKMLNLSDCVLSEGGEVPSILTALAGGSNLELHTLELQNNNLEGKTFSLIAGVISTHLQNVKTLALQWNDVEEDEESLETLRLALKARGGKLLVSDEDEEEDEDESVDEGKVVDEAESGRNQEDEDEVVPSKPIPTDFAKAADELAELLGKTSIS